LSRPALNLDELPEEVRSDEKLAKAFWRGQLTRDADASLVAKLVANDESFLAQSWENRQKINRVLFDDTSWDTATVLSWIAFRKVACLHMSWRAENWYASAGEQLLVESNPCRALLATLRAAILVAVDRIGINPAPGYWLRIQEAQVHRLDFRFSQLEILKVWPPIGKPTRGAKPIKIQESIVRLRRHVSENRLSAEELRGMREKDLAQVCGFSRETARKARDAILSEFSANKFRQ
jgi:hypothetical protein